MTDSFNDSTQPFSKTICSICYEDLKPSVEDLQAISICGHVFHELCIQQWFEYCKNKKKQCPICKQTCSASHVSRLYFQSVGDSNDDKLSQEPKIHSEDPNELKLEVRKLEWKIGVMNSRLESQENQLKDNSVKLCGYEEQLQTEISRKNEALGQTRFINDSLKLKTDELNKSNLECEKLKKMNEKLEMQKTSLAKEVAQLKLVVELDLKDEEIERLASLGNEPFSRNTLVTLKKSLAARNKLYKELMERCRTLEGNKARSYREFEKAKEEIEKLKEKIQKMETTKKMQENEVMNGLKVSKRKNSPSVLNRVDHTINGTCTPQESMKERDINLGESKRSKVSENINESNNKDGISSYILIDDDDAPKVPNVPKFSSNESVRQPTKRATTDAESSSKNVYETSEPNGACWHDYTDDDLGRVRKSGQDKPLLNITKEASFIQKDFCFSAGVLGPDGTKSYLGKWSKIGQSKGHNASFMPRQTSGDLIAEGADGRGGTVKVLKSHFLSSSQNNKRPLTFAKSGKLGAKASSSHSQRSLHYYTKAGH